MNFHDVKLGSNQISKTETDEVKERYNPAELTWIHCYVHITFSVGIFAINDNFEFVQTNSKLKSKHNN